MPKNECLKALSITELRNISILLLLVPLFLFSATFFDPSGFDDIDSLRSIRIGFLLFSLLLLSFTITFVWVERNLPKCIISLTDKYLKIPEASFLKWDGLYLSIPLGKIKKVSLVNADGNFHLKILIDGVYKTRKSSMMLGHLSHTLDKKKSFVTYYVSVGGKKLGLLWEEKLNAIIKREAN